jgi:hypothetical protein
MDKGYIFMGIGFISGIIISRKIIGSQKVARPTLENIDNFEITLNSNNENIQINNTNNNIKRKVNENKLNSENLNYNYGENNYSFSNKIDLEESSPYNQYIKNDPFNKK